MSRARAPDGWPTPRQVGDHLLARGLVDGATGVRRAALLDVRPWSVVYGIDIDRAPSEPVRLVAKSIREPHHDGPGQGPNHLRRLGLELETMEQARAQRIPVPRPYGLIPELGAIVMERVTGNRLLSLHVKERHLVSTFEQIGRECRRWNSLAADIDGVTTTATHDVVAEVRRHVALLAERGLGPAMTPPGRRALDVVMTTEDGALVATHGDLHSGNVLVDGASNPIFMDSAVVRAPAISDIARLSASVRTSRWSLIGGFVVRARVERLVSALLAGYGGHDRRLCSLSELAATLEQWWDLRGDLASGRHRWTRRAGVHLVDALFTAEIERWGERVESFSVTRSSRPSPSERPAPPWPNSPC